MRNNLNRAREEYKSPIKKHSEYAPQKIPSEIEEEPATDVRHGLEPDHKDGETVPTDINLINNT